MTVYLKNINTGLIWDYDGIEESEHINKHLQGKDFELIDQDKMTKEEKKLLKIPKTPKTITLKNQLIAEAEGSE